jgi:hypothetical protein
VDRIEIVDRAGEMLKAHHRRGALLAEATIGEAHTADILELGRRGFVEIDSMHLVLLVVITFVHNAWRTLSRFSYRPDRVFARCDAHQHSVLRWLPLGQFGLLQFTTAREILCPANEPSPICSN